MPARDLGLAHAQPVAKSGRGSGREAAFCGRTRGLCVRRRWSGGGLPVVCKCAARPPPSSARVHTRPSLDTEVVVAPAVSADPPADSGHPATGEAPTRVGGTLPLPPDRRRRSLPLDLLRGLEAGPPRGSHALRTCACLLEDARRRSEWQGCGVCASAAAPHARRWPLPSARAAAACLCALCALASAAGACRRLSHLGPAGPRWKRRVLRMFLCERCQASAGGRLPRSEGERVRSAHTYTHTQLDLSLITLTASR